MGLDMRLQALPEGPEWWNYVLANEGIRENLSLLPSVMHQAGHLPTTGDLGQLVTELIGAHPGIERRNCNLDRLWDTLSYLLSEQRRDMIEDEAVDTTDLGLIAVRGEHALGWNDEEVCGFQGIPLGFTSVSTVSSVSAFLEGITDSDFQAAFDPDAMEQADVYKSPGSDEWDEILTTFHDLKRFYRDAASHKEGALICLD